MYSSALESADVSVESVLKRLPTLGRNMVREREPKCGQTTAGDKRDALWRIAGAVIVFRALPGFGGSMGFAPVSRFLPG